MCNSKFLEQQEWMNWKQKETVFHFFWKKMKNRDQNNQQKQKTVDTHTQMYGTIEYKMDAQCVLDIYFIYSDVLYVTWV